MFLYHMTSLHLKCANTTRNIQGGYLTCIISNTYVQWKPVGTLFNTAEHNLGNTEFQPLLTIEVFWPTFAPDSSLGPTMLEGIDAYPIFTSKSPLKSQFSPGKCTYTKKFCMWLSSSQIPMYSIHRHPHTLKYSQKKGFSFSSLF